MAEGVKGCQKTIESSGVQWDGREGIREILYKLIQNHKTVITTR